jgi:hypothetical protein
LEAANKLGRLNQLTSLRTLYAAGHPFLLPFRVDDSPSLVSAVVGFPDAQHSMLSARHKFNFSATIGNINGEMIAHRALPSRIANTLVEDNPSVIRLAKVGFIG